MMRPVSFVLCVLWATTTTTTAFLARPELRPLSAIPANHRNAAPSRATTLLLEAKKGKKRPSGAGFGKVDTSPPASKSSSEVKESPAVDSRSASQQSSPFLRSVQVGGSSSNPVVEEVEQDQTLSPKERAENILRNKYGLKTLEEQQLDAKQLARKQEERARWKQMREKAEKDEDFDIMAILPGPVLLAIDRFLKIGVTVTGVAFVLAGVGITLEAWSTVSGNVLPENIDKFIVETIEPNFTTGLLVLLGFSVSLGVFSALKLSSSGAQYKEDN